MRYRKRSSSKAIDGFENHLDHGKKQAHKNCDDPQHDDEFEQRLTGCSAKARAASAIDRKTGK
jgi:hypothetical protein